MGIRSAKCDASHASIRMLQEEKHDQLRGEVVRERREIEEACEYYDLY